MAKKNLSMEELLARKKKALANGNMERVARLESRISKKAMKNPESAVAAGQYYAQDEFQQNINANRPDQYTIGGSQTYSVDPLTGKTTVNQALSPEQQALYDQQVAQTGAANAAFMQGLQSGNYGQGPQFGSSQDLLDERTRIEDATYDRNMAQIDKSFDHRRAQLEQRLYETGAMPGSPKYDQMMGDLNDEYSQAEKQVRQDAVAQGGAEFERSFNIGLRDRQGSLGELATLSSFGGGPTVQPNFFGFQPIQYQGPQYLDYLQTGIEQGLGWGQINKPTGGGGGGTNYTPFSIGTAPAPLPQAGNYPNPVSTGFATGFSTGVPVGIAAS